MMQTKMFEIHDLGLVELVLAIRFDPDGEWEMAAFCQLGCMAQLNAKPLPASLVPEGDRHGWPRTSRVAGREVGLLRIAQGVFKFRETDWSDRTLMIAHRHIHWNWPDLEHGSLIDVGYILREKAFEEPSILLATHRKRP